MRACARLPENISQVAYSINKCPSTRHTFLPNGPSRDTSMSVPKCACSLIATTAPRKVIQTNNQRDNSSDTVMPELAA